MNKNIEIKMISEYNDSEILKYETFVFPAGEQHVVLNTDNFNDTYYKKITIKALIKSSSDLILLLLIKDAIDRINVNNLEVNLFLPYVPYSRQDRICREGEPLSIQVLSNLINGMNFNIVIVYDTHSNVTDALINNIFHVKQVDLFNEVYKIHNEVIDECSYIISPDAGANKKTFEIAKVLNKEMIQADKVRDVITGNITKTKVYASKEKLKNKSVLIVDDIIDGGTTMIKLAEKLKKKGVDKIYVYVTHGIFSKGKQVLLDAGINEIFTIISFIEEGNTNED